MIKLIIRFPCNPLTRVIRDSDNLVEENKNYSLRVYFCEIIVISLNIFPILTKMTKNSSLPRNIPIVSVHRTATGAFGEVTPIDIPTVLRAEVNSKRESWREYPW